MLHVPEDIQAFYKVQLKNVDREKHYTYVRSIRYYLDFCSKYRFTPYEKNSFSHFSQKLYDKKQSLECIEEAYQAVQLLLPYYERPPVAGEMKSSLEVVQTLIAVLREKNYSPRTLSVYTKWTRQFLQFHTGEVSAINDGTVRMFLNHLVVKRNVSPSAHNQAFNSLLFLFRHVLKKDFGEQSGTIRAKRPGKKIPVVLTRNELQHLFSSISADYLFHFQLMYGCGLRLMELVELRIKDIDFEADQITVSFSKNQKEILK